MRKVVAEPFPDPLVRDSETFGQAVRAARTAAGISLESAAEALAVSKVTLSALEGGKGTVALGTALRIARDLGVTVLAAPTAMQFEAAAALQALRNAEPAAWGPPARPPKKRGPAEGKTPR